MKTRSVSAASIYLNETFYKRMDIFMKISSFTLLLLVTASCNGLMKVEGELDDDNNNSQPTVFSCPTGFLMISANTNRSLDEFCVMKYEAKAATYLPDGSTQLNTDGCSAGCATTGWATIYNAQSNPTGHFPISVAEGKPWRQITLSDAKAACQSRGSKYDLISNEEWMAVGEDVIFQNENWSGGSVDSGTLKRSNAGYDTAGVAYNGDDPEAGDSRNTLASHKLSSGEYIFDLSGNLWEWVEWEKNTALAYPGECNTGGWVLNSAVNCPAWNVNSYRPIIPNSEVSIATINNMGRLTSSSGVATRAVTRGAASGNSTFTGIFAMWGSADRTVGYGSVGFRCVYRK